MPVEFESIEKAHECARELAEELATGEGSWIALLVQASVPVDDVVEVWVVQEVDLEVTRCRVKGR